MTFSISARCPRTGELGVAVTSSAFAIGAAAAQVRPAVGIAVSLGLPHAQLRTACLDAMAAGLTPDAALRHVLSQDAQADQRQLGLMDAQGRPAAYTGRSCEGMAGYVVDADCVIAGNGLIGRAVQDAMLQAWTIEEGLPHAERLVTALEAGQRAGGDKRGKSSAVLLVSGPNPERQIDLRVDDHREPLTELRRLLALYLERHAPRQTGVAAMPALATARR